MIAKRGQFTRLVSPCGPQHEKHDFLDLFGFVFVSIFLFFHCFSKLFQGVFPMAFSGPPRGICTSGESSGDLNLTDFVNFFFFEKNSVFV